VPRLKLPAPWSINFSRAVSWHTLPTGSKPHTVVAKCCLRKVTHCTSVFFLRWSLSHRTHHPMIIAALLNILFVRHFKDFL
jgi:hypothetical protein